MLCKPNKVILFSRTESYFDLLLKYYEIGVNTVYAPHPMQGKILTT